MSAAILTATNINKGYKSGLEPVQVLRSIDLSLKAGEFAVIAGSSGSGKTTLLSILSGLDRPDDGEVHIDGREITALSEDQLAPVRNALTGFVFQAFHLVPSLTALENVMFPAELKGDPQARERAGALLERVGLERRKNNFPEQLSGGEQQRVAICRAMINSPKILFGDEPTGNLDSENSREITKLLLEMHREQGATLLIATHSRSLARQADRIILLHDGIIESDS